MTFRDKADPLTQLTTLNAVEHGTLKTDGAQSHHLWSDTQYQHRQLVDKFRAEVKDHYFWHQGYRCCYCSTELQPNARVYDAEHILDKSGFPEFMFHPENIAVACVICNTHKSAKSVLSDDTVRPLTIPALSTDYKILHPHFDEWDHHLSFDELGRIVPVPGSTKGPETISICAMDGINLLRLSRKFAPASRKGVYKLMCKVVTYVSPSKIEDTFALMQKLADQSPDALAVVATLRDRVAQMQAQRAAEATAAQAALLAPRPTLALPAPDNPLAGGL
ncbi:HNH endonuclease [Achromobacter xylosoxidans]|uniref:HNH endonuclease n=1 Tax=Alcaligenes xylosoxydans xylosoxydans TaxID=85698 RepID=UPI0006C5C529|nr:hypothetical protein [Achromobacter xylosoxidans]MCH4577245.1 recombination protein NinG [Achromobacter xylosoxidans]MDD7990436.1 hypothetical protein [Achromobacter xylosoxidans]NEV06164.1 hypothetical protein [Achromobacter xylosoxidans]OFO59363.1 hypothetical protein HMPREF3024_27595 [Achromobacter xylosoxidans]OMG80375.1 hypothetical protein BIZ53_30975 [Achromobacter xylosoxidans]